jgi:RNA polymerase sigma-70 factor (ECF subfamily)
MSNNAWMHNNKELIDRCLQGNPKAQEILYKQYSPRMYGICLRYAQNTLEADDILQEAFIKVFKYLSDFNHEGSFEGWIRRIVINTAINYYRSKIREWDEVSIDRAGHENDLKSTDIDKMTRDDLLNIIRELPEGYRVVFNLYVIEGYNHQEIGKLLNISENTSKSQLSRARVVLQQKIKQRKLND